MVKLIAAVALCLAASLAHAEEIASTAEEPATQPAALETKPATAVKAEPLALKGELPPGFKVKKRGKFTVYCKTDTPIGSRFKKETCLDDQQMRDYMVWLQENKSDIDRIRATCASACACGQPEAC